jgi:hypothetical protein
MGKLAVLKSVSFEIKRSFDDLSDECIKKYLENKLDFINFNNTYEMFHTVKKTFSEYIDPDIEVANCYYNKKYIIQSFSVDNENESIHNSIVLVKRKINDNDTYTFSEFDPNKPESDVYNYDDITIEDIEKIIRKKSIINCVDISSDGKVKNENIILLNQNNDVGKILLQNKKTEIFYLNMSNIMNKYNNSEHENRIDEIIREKTNAYCTSHFFTQIDIGLGILNCYYENSSENKNEVISKLIGHDIYGNAIVFLQSNFDNDTETFLDLDNDLFNRLFDIITNEKKLKRKNEYFFNIYRELLADEDKNQLSTVMN